MITAFLFSATTLLQGFIRWNEIDWKALIAGAALLFGLYQFWMRKRVTRDTEMTKLRAADEFKREKESQDIKTAKQAYQAILRNELGSIKMVGTPDVQDVGLELPDVFVHLNISEQYHGEAHVRLEDPERGMGHERDFTPDQVLHRAYGEYSRRALLIIGDPGSGKTTLMKYYALTCLEPGGHKQLQLGKPHYPFFSPCATFGLSRTWRKISIT